MIMRVAYLSDILSGHDIRFLAGIVGCGHETHLVTFYPGAELPAGVKSIPGLRTVRLRAEGFPHVSGGWRVSRAVTAWRGIVRATRMLKQALDAIRPDILHAGWLQTSGLIAARSGFHPLMVMPWGSDVLLWPDRSFLDRRKAVHALRHADLVQCDACHVRDRIRAISGVSAEKILVFPWGVDLGRFSPGAPADSLRIRLGWREAVVAVVTRQLKPVYGHAHLLAAAAFLRESCPRLRWLIIGEGRLGDSLREDVRRRGLVEMVHFAGRMEIDRVADALRESDMYVSSSLSDGTSLSLLEAMACGLPAVVTDLPAIREWVADGENGFLAPPANPEALAGKIRILYDDESLRRRFGQENLRIARERADWSRHVRTLDEAYRMIGSKKSASLKK
ncbi:MAG: glycosyltransferase family 4 protein [Planctomycetota bacterium]